MLSAQTNLKRCLLYYRAFTSLTTATPHNTANSLTQRIIFLSNEGNLQQALSLLYTLPHTTQLSLYPTLLHQCIHHNTPHIGRSLHHHYNNSAIPNTIIIDNHIVNMYAKCGWLGDARKVFDGIPVRNVVSWSVMVSGYVRCGFGDEGFRVFCGMVRECGGAAASEFLFSSVLSGGGFWEGRQVHGVVVKLGFEGCLFVANALISMYCRGGCGDGGWRVFESMGFRNMVSWNSMVAGFQVMGLGERAVRVFVDMRRRGIGFDRATVLSVISSLLGNGVGVGFKFCSQLLCLCIKAGVILEIEVNTAFVKAYSDLGGDVADCYRLFLESSSSQDIVSWTGIITALSERDPEKAFSLFRQLRREGLVPDWHTFSIVLKSCAGFVTECPAMAVHSQVIRAGFLGNTVIANALIHAYSRSGSLPLSKQVFNEMETYDLVSWNSMLKAYALHGQAEEALHLFSQMDVKPDSLTYVALLSACSHAGIVREGKRLFEAMSERHGIVPQLDHYACIVDILGRAGQVSEAMKFISQMPMKPDAVVWSALLGACRKHGEIQLAKSAAGKLRELDPEGSLGYVQMSNMFCSGGSFNTAGMIRNKMKGTRVKKEPGLSWVDVRNHVHEFASGGWRHPQREAICAELEIFIGKLKEIGYVPQTSLALHDIEEEQKEEQLYHHSEKLALIFAVMNKGNLNCGHIRIMKNIRICVDCHNFMKLASDLIKKEIVVRDSNRFHHFKDRVCTCKDYW